MAVCLGEREAARFPRARDHTATRTQGGASCARLPWACLLCTFGAGLPRTIGLWERPPKWLRWFFRCLRRAHFSKPTLSAPRAWIVSADRHGDQPVNASVINPILDSPPDDVLKWSARYVALPRYGAPARVNKKFGVACQQKQRRSHPSFPDGSGRHLRVGAGSGR